MDSARLFSYGRLHIRATGRPVTKSSKILQRNDFKGANVKEIEKALLIRGTMKTAVASDVGIATLATSALLMIPDPNDPVPGIAFEFFVNQPGTFYFGEDVTVSANGTPVPLKNRNRNFVDGANFQIFQNPTVTDDGDEIFSIQTISEDARKGEGVTPVLPLSWVLNPSKAYLLRFTNSNIGVADADLFVDLTEPVEEA